MEPPTGFCASLLSFIRFLPFFIGLLLLGTIKGILFCPLICLIIATGNTAIILGLWIVHSVWTYYCVVRAKQFGPILKLVIGLCVLPVLLVVYPIVGILGSIVGGAAYGFLSPIFATLEAVEEGKDVKFYHCFIDGTWSTVEKSCMVVRDVKDVCFHSYFSVMDDLRQKGPPDAKYYEIRLLYIPGALIASVIGIIVDVPVISFVALCKGPYMLFKGWHRLFHDLIGREGPFLETICVPFAGLAILLWPLAVAGAILASMLASFFLGAYAGVVAYQCTAQAVADVVWTLYGRDPPILLEYTEDLSIVEINQLVAKRNVVLDELKSYLVLAHKKMKQYTDSDRRDVREVGAKSTSCNVLQMKQDMMVNRGCSISARSWDNIFEFHLEGMVKVLAEIDRHPLLTYSTRKKKHESSFLFGLSYVIAASAIYDEYSNDILDMPEGSCFPRPQFRKDVDASQRTSNSNSVSRPSSFRKAPSRTSSMKNNNIAELKSFELLDALFKECFHVGEKMVSEGIITREDIEEAKSGNGSRVISIGLPAYCLVQGLLRSAKLNSVGIMISDETELTITNRPRETFFDWFVNPLLIIKEQIKAENLSASEEDYLCKLVLLGGDAERLKKSSVGPAPESDVKRAELEALARRLQGITKSMSRFPTFKRRFNDLVRSLSDDLKEKSGGPIMTRSKSAFARLISLKSFKGTRANGSAQGSQHVARDLENS
ncbi:putative membrane protein [Glycine soja]